MEKNIGGGYAIIQEASYSQYVDSNFTVDEFTESGEIVLSESINILTIPFSKPHTENPFIVLIADVTDAGDESPTQTQYGMLLVNIESILGAKFNVGGETKYSAINAFQRRSSGSSAAGWSASNITEEAFELKFNDNSVYGEDGSSSTVWRANRKFKWWAIWKN